MKKFSPGLEIQVLWGKKTGFQDEAVLIRAGTIFYRWIKNGSHLEAILKSYIMNMNRLKKRGITQKDIFRYAEKLT